MKKSYPQHNASNGFKKEKAKKPKRYWVLKCRVYRDEEGVECFDFLDVLPLFVERTGDSRAEMATACRTMQEMLQWATAPCNCMFIFTDAIDPKPLTTEWEAHWQRLVALEAKGEARTAPFERLHEDFHPVLTKLDPETGRNLPWQEGESCQ